MTASFIQISKGEKFSNTKNVQCRPGCSDFFVLFLGYTLKFDENQRKK